MRKSCIPPAPYCGWRMLRIHWHGIALGMLILAATALCVYLYWTGSDSGRRAAIVLGFTLIGMLVLAAIVCR